MKILFLFKDTGCPWFCDHLA